MTAVINEIDLVRCRELVAKLSEIRQRLEGSISTEYAYWQGYLRCYCEQNAISSEMLARIWEDPT